MRQLNSLELFCPLAVLLSQYHPSGLQTRFEQQASCMTGLLGILIDSYRLITFIAFLILYSSSNIASRLIWTSLSNSIKLHLHSVHLTTFIVLHLSTTTNTYIS
ncbi:hypothetical protein BDR07DRAFT_63178 [Suillus spraguei]|nr:hypothetical protein BDR07DRAFT_63178 [Suillus spraguei]